MNLIERQQAIIARFSGFTSWEEKYRYIIELGKRLKPYPEEFRTEDFKVKGCQSQVWLHARLNESGEIIFTADSDALIVKGLIALLVELYSDAKPTDILVTNPDFIKALDLGAHLSPSRANGLFAMVKQIKFYAAAFKYQNS